MSDCLRAKERERMNVFCHFYISRIAPHSKALDYFESATRTLCDLILLDG